jgi:thiol-disulfide isomerase/thioredoxin
MIKKCSLQIAVTILFIVSMVVHAQSIKIHLSNYTSGKGILHSLSGEKMESVDSARFTKDGKLSYQFTGNKYHNGIYRWVLENNKWIDFVYTGLDIELKTDVNNLLDSMKVINSESNRIYYTFIKLNKAYKIKTELLQLILARYPKDDEYYKITQRKINQLQDEYLDFITNVSQKEPNSFIARYISSAHLPIVNFNLPLDQQLVFLKTHALDDVDFNNAALINSDLFTNKAIEYLTYYRNPQLPKELLEKEFISAVDSILNKAKVHHLVYQHIVEYLIDGFKKFGFDQVLDYIVQNYVIKDDLCLDTKTESSIQRRLNQNKKLPVGAIVQNIILPDIGNKEINLSKIKFEKVLILFYASWCPHCQTLIPQLFELYKNLKEKKFEVLAISLDNKKEDWLQFVNNNKLTWLNVSDLKGWDTKAAADYFIYATPTMFLVDKEGKILAKPLTIAEVEKVISIP